MKPYALKVIQPEDVFLFGKIKKAIEELPHVNLGRDEKGREIELSCHMLARAVAKFFPVRVRDGLGGLDRLACPGIAVGLIRSCWGPCL